MGGLNVQPCQQDPGHDEQHGDGCVRLGELELAQALLPDPASGNSSQQDADDHGDQGPDHPSHALDQSRWFVGESQEDASLHRFHTGMTEPQWYRAPLGVRAVLAGIVVRAHVQTQLRGLDPSSDLRQRRRILGPATGQVGAHPLSPPEISYPGRIFLTVSMSLITGAVLREISVLEVVVEALDVEVAALSQHPQHRFHLGSLRRDHRGRRVEFSLGSVTASIRRARSSTASSSASLDRMNRRMSISSGTSTVTW